MYTTGVKLSLGALLLAASADAVPTAAAAPDNRTFTTWAARHGKIYDSASERLHRLETWLENARAIHDHANEGHSYTLEMNEFAVRRRAGLTAQPESQGHR